MRHFFLLIIICLIFQGCTATVHITDAYVENVDQGNIVLAVKTEEDLSSYEQSKYAHFVMLKYYINRENLVPTGDYAKLSAEYPFSAKRRLENHYDSGNGDYLSRWKIPLYKEANTSTEEYEYNLLENSENTITIRIYGATMGGGHLDSAPYTIQLPNLNTSSQ